MSSPDPTCQDKLRQPRVFFGVTSAAQHLDVFGVGAFRQVSGVWVDMVALQTVYTAAFFALRALLKNLANCFPGCVAAFTRTALPVMVIRTGQLFATSHCHTWDRAVFARATVALAEFKLFPACFASTMEHRLLLSRAYFLRTSNRARLRCTSDVRIRACECTPAGWASQRSMTTV